MRQEGKEAASREHYWVSYHYVQVEVNLAKELQDTMKSLFLE